MNPPPHRDSAALRFAQGLILFLLYVVAGKLGLMLATDNPSVTPVWAPTGIALAGLLLRGRSLWPAVFLGAFVVNVTTAGGPWASAGIAAGNTLEALVGATLVRRFAGGARAFSEPQSIFAFALHAGVLAAMVGASIGVATLGLAHLVSADHAYVAWVTWWLGDGAGALLVTPLLLLWTERRAWEVTPRRLPEVAVLCVAILVVSGLAFAGVLPAGLGFTGASLLAWAAFRFGQRVTVTATVLLAALAIWGTMRGHGPFVRGGVNDSLLMLQTYMAVIAVTALAMSAAVRQQRAATDQVRHLAGQLEGEVSARTRELAETNERLREQIRERRRAEGEREALWFEQAARLEAERANRQKDEFLATLSHELRTPLNAIVGWAQLLQRGSLDAVTRLQAVNAIERNARIQTRLISDILDVSRITAGKFELRPQPLDPRTLVESTVELVRPQAVDKCLRLQVSVHDAGIVTGDLERLEQAIGNVMSNAVKFTPEGGGVDVTLRRDGDGVEIQVADTGPGIEPEFLPFVFDRFKQRDSSSTRRHGGLGLGLSIARHILTQHGGEITAANRPEGGAVFAIRLPAAVAGARVLGPGAPPEPDDLLRSPVLAGLRVLVIDDQDSARDLATAVLTGCGARVVTAASSAEALQHLRRLSFDVIVTDLSMPGEDGYQFLARARAGWTDGVDEVPTIALTAVAGPDEAQRAHAAGFRRFIVKPASPATLVNAVVAVTAADASAHGGPDDSV